MQAARRGTASSEPRIPRAAAAPARTQVSGLSRSSRAGPRISRTPKPRDCKLSTRLHKYGKVFSRAAQWSGGRFVQIHSDGERRIRVRAQFEAEACWGPLGRRRVKRTCPAGDRAAALVRALDSAPAPHGKQASATNCARPCSSAAVFIVIPPSKNRLPHLRTRLLRLRWMRSEQNVGNPVECAGISHSARSVTIGSTLVWCKTGIQIAGAAAPSTAAAAAARVRGSRGLTP